MSRVKTTDIKNGIGRPSATSIYGRVWAISDTVAATGIKKLRAEVLSLCSKEGIGNATASVAHCLWRRYNGKGKQ